MLLDAAALGSALRRAGVRASEPEPVDAAPDDLRAPPPQRAVQLLELFLHQSPVGATLMPRLVAVWLEAAEAAGCRVPHHLLPELLDLATAKAEMRPGVRRVVDARGAWLAAANPAWSWAAGEAVAAEAPATVDAAVWARSTIEVRLDEMTRLRRTEAGAARGLVESTWDTDAAPDRAALLSALVVGIGLDDEPLLERALDDRSARVRSAAAQLLDALPGSARAARMAERLRPLLRHTGRLRKTLEVELPAEPDAAGVRDGLVKPKGVGSVRGWWLQRLAAGAPLEVWTDATSSGPEAAWRMVADRDARAGIVEAVLARGDATWAAAVIADVWHPGLLVLLPPERLEATASRQLGVAATPWQIEAVVSAVPAPWGPVFSHAVLQVLAAEKEPIVLVSRLTARLAAGLDPATRPALEKWMGSLAPGARERVARISQYLALVPEIPEAFR
jgi:hypothetical protein